MRGTSQASRDAALTAFRPAAEAAGEDASLLAHELYSVVDALDSSGSLRRALTDSARPGTDKAALVSALFHGMDLRVRTAVSDFANRRWWDEYDLGDALEDAAVEALLASAQAAGRLEAVEDELFEVERFLTAERGVYSALDNRSAIPEARSNLAKAVLGGRVSSTTSILVERACRAPRGRRLVRMIGYFQSAAAARRARIVAHVTSAVRLSETQRERLTRSLSERHGRDVVVNVTVDPRVVGGLKVQVGDEVVDGTIAARLVDARRLLAG